MQDEREDGDVVLRVEKGSRGKRTHDLALLNAEQYVFVARAQPKLSFHEVISNDTVRFVMDVDGCQFVDTIDRIVMNAQEVLMRYCPDQ
jgi:hypothetical protein